MEEYILRLKQLSSNFSYEAFIDLLKEIDSQIISGNIKYIKIIFGIIIILLGLNYMEILKIELLNRTSVKKLHIIRQNVQQHRLSQCLNCNGISLSFTFSQKLNT